MKKRQLTKMILSIIVPPISVLVFFVLAIGVIILPATEEAMMQSKKDTLRSVVMSATSIIQKHSQMEKEGLVSKEQAQQTALSDMRALRYGEGKTGYLWIMDLQLVMLEHPYFPELEGTKLDYYADKNGKYPFVDAAAVAREQGEGYIDYMWPKQGNIQESLPKLSYVSLFEPWGWIVGSGIYLDDVQSEIGSVTRRLFMISGLIGFFVVGLLAFDIWRGWKSEKGRYLAKMELIRSRERYQALAHASREIVFLTIDGVIAGANKAACETLGLEEKDIISRDFFEIVGNPEELKQISSDQTSETKGPLETILLGNNRAERVLLTTDSLIVNEKRAIIYVGHSLQLKDNTSTGGISNEALSDIGLGVLKVDNTLSGKITSADRIAAELLGNGAETIVIGHTLHRFLGNDAGRLFVQLESAGKVKNMLVRCSDTLSRSRYLLASAATIEESDDAPGRILVTLTDITSVQAIHEATDRILTEFLSPQNSVLRGYDFFDPAPVEENLNELYLRSQVLLRQAVKMGVASELVTCAMSETIKSIFRGAIKKAINTLGPPPCGYAFLMVGSVGRSESTLTADQDSALIFESSDDDTASAEYFRRLGTLVTSICSDAGIPPCHAENTAANPKWCLEEAEWKHQFSSWIHHGEPEDLLNVNVFFDFSVVSGDEELANRLRQHLFAEVKKHSVFLHHLAESTIEFRPPATGHGHIKSESKVANCVDLKGAMLHFINFARIYALKNSNSETNTIRRLEALMEARHIGQDTGEETIDAWKFLVGLRLRNQVTALESNFAHENTLMLDELTSWEKSMLKKAMAQVNNLQQRLSSDIVRMV